MCCDLLGHLLMIPPQHRGDVLKDPRVYWRPGGAAEVRGFETWREAHKVALKLEKAESSAKALVGAVGGEGLPGSGAPGQRKRGGRGSGHEADVAAVDGDRSTPKACFEPLCAGTDNLGLAFGAFRLPAVKPVTQHVRFLF